MSKEDEFFSFEEALDELRLQEEELKRLVSEGEIRAFREGETMKLRRTDVENLRSELSGGEVIDLGGASEELVFEDDSDFEDAGMATEEISEADTILEDDVEDIGEVELEDEDIEDLAEVPAAAGAAAVRRTPRSQTAAEPETEGLGMLVAMLLTAAVLILSIPIALNMSRDTVDDLSAGIMGIVGAEVQQPQAPVADAGQ